MRYRFTAAELKVIFPEASLQDPSAATEASVDQGRRNALAWGLWKALEKLAGHHEAPGHLSEDIASNALESLERTVSRNGIDPRGVNKTYLEGRVRMTAEALRKKARPLGQNAPVDPEAPRWTSPSDETRLEEAEEGAGQVQPRGGGREVDVDPGILAEVVEAVEAGPEPLAEAQRVAARTEVWLERHAGSAATAEHIRRFVWGRVAGSTWAELAEGTGMTPGHFRIEGQRLAQRFARVVAIKEWMARDRLGAARRVPSLVDFLYTPPTRAGEMGTLRSGNTQFARWVEREAQGAPFHEAVAALREQLEACRARLPDRSDDPLFPGLTEVYAIADARIRALEAQGPA